MIKIMITKPKKTPDHLVMIIQLMNIFMTCKDWTNRQGKQVRAHRKCPRCLSYERSLIPLRFEAREKGCLSPRACIFIGGWETTLSA